jgi:MtrB/PioB family decaheme-associated outer membrane protein
MKTNAQEIRFQHTTIALALLATFGPAAAAENDEVAQLISPDSAQVSAGLGLASGDHRDRALWGQYNGMRKEDGSLLLDFDYTTRDDATGLWTHAEGRNLGLDTRELRLYRDKQGDWKVGVEYTEMVKRDLRTVNTGMSGAGTTTPTLNYLATPGTGDNEEFKIKRSAFGVSLSKWFGSNLQLETSYKHEDRDGARIFGKGFACASGAAPGCGAPSATATGWAVLLVPEPINSTTHQFEGKLTFSGDKFAVTGGYYGSMYDNALKTVTPSVPGTLNNPLGTPLPLSAGLQDIMNLPMALPPDNQAHQFYLTGHYSITPATHLNFKYAYTRATQDASYPGVFSPPPGVSNLGGEVNTQLAHIGLSARPIPKLSISAKLRYEDKDDKTPIETYNVEGTTFFTNNRNSIRKLGGNLEGTYQLPADFRLTAGINYESIKRALPVATTEVAGLSALREETKETGYRLELKKSFGETLMASIGYLGSVRDGSNWMSLSTTTNATILSTYCGGVTCYGQILPASSILGISNSTGNAAGVTNSTAIFPSMLMDRKRDKWRAAVDWNPTERLSVQLMLEDGKDKNDMSGAVRGLQDTDMQFVNVDVTYALSDDVRLTGFASHGKQSVFVNHSTGYAIEMANTTDTFGLGVQGRLNSRIDLGGDISYSDDVNKYKQSADPTILSAANVTVLGTLGQLPDVHFTQTVLRLYGTYMIDKASAVRVDLVHAESKLKEWTWGSGTTFFAYGDNTTVSMQPKQTLSFIGARYIYKF